MIAKEIGYPNILKATAGGGGKGMRIVWEESELERNPDMAKTEAAAAFKNDGVCMEKFVEEPRHIEIQVAGDQYGTACHPVNATARSSAVTRNWWKNRLLPS